MCPATTQDRNGFCEAHAHLASGWNKAERGTAEQRGYGSDWRKLSKAIQQRDRYLCQPCLKLRRVSPSVAADHVIPKAEGGTDDPDNLQAICAECHKAKTAAERDRANARMRGADEVL
ncbi:HNH endonuclease [Pseudomonas nitroreducens]|uniref:HNH endonuclease n=1 Tax=Pseudomonas nitroreducens TaxID=46680 RepID=UPI00265A07B5|nr:HNH endonuclease signature motif containing protein [Pseudomonas nitroreducens]MCP1652694.1 5-methylcytosine-specific restriction protein A [Pseudomonas nitroreducens]